MTDRDNTPAGTMDDLISAYADGELDEASAATVEAYLADHPAAQRALAMHRDTSSLLRSAFGPAVGLPAPAALAPPSPRRGGGRFGWAIAASVAAGLIGYAAGATWPLSLESDKARLLADIAESHDVYSRETVHLVEVPASQTDHLKAWLGKRINGTLPIPDLREAGLTFAGGRMVAIDGNPAAELMYTRANGRPIGFMVYAHAGPPSGLVVERRGNMSLATWDDGSHSFVLVGDTDPDLMRTLAVLAQRQV